MTTSPSNLEDRIILFVRGKRRMVGEVWLHCREAESTLTLPQVAALLEHLVLDGRIESTRNGYAIKIPAGEKTVALTVKKT